MTDAATDAGTEIITIPHKTDVPALFGKKDGIANLVDKIEKEALSIVIDHSTAKGRKEVKSLAAKVSRSKTLIDEVGKEENEERNRLNKEVNAIRNMAKDRLDALRDKIKKPVDDWEAAEAERVRQHMIRMDIFALERATGHDDSATIQGVIDTITAAEVDVSWEEYEADAKAARAAALVKYEADLGIAKAREAQEAELEALREEKVKRDQEAADRAIAEQKEKDEAEKKARAEREKAEAVQAERIANAKAEERRRIEHAEELAAAKRQVEEEVQAERDRIAAEKAAEEEAQAKRAADKKHLQKIRAEVVASIVAINAENYEEIVDAMLAGEIKHVIVQI